MNNILEHIDNLIEETKATKATPLRNAKAAVKKVVRKVKRLHPLQTTGNAVQNASSAVHSVGKYSPEKIGNYLRTRWNTGRNKATLQNSDLDKKIGAVVTGVPLAAAAIGGAYAAKKHKDKQQ